MYRKPLLLVTFFSCCCLPSFSQYILNGSAEKISCNCYTLTRPIQTQSGSVWNSQKIDLEQPFDFWFNVFLGCEDASGADGMVFMLQPLSTSVGTTGEGMGFQGVAPSIGIALDTWTNSNLFDPGYDHISIQANGNANHTFDLASPVPISAVSSNVEDCNWHKLRIVWEPGIKKLSAHFDGVLRVSYTGDIINTIFNGNSRVYWGFSAATGGAFNLQQFCTALNPDFITNTPNLGTCIGNSLSFSNTSVSFAPIAATYWDFGDGTTTTAVDPAPHLYTRPGVYPVKLAITAQDGCKSDTLKKNITIATLPDAKFAVFDTCFKLPVRWTAQAQNIGVAYQWRLDGVDVDTARIPRIPALPAGNHTLSASVKSLFGCGEDIAAHAFTIKPVPVVAASFEDVCINLPTLFSADQKDNSTTISQWHWNFGDGQSSSIRNPEHTYKKEALFPVRMWAVGTNGCASDTVAASVQIVAPFAAAGNDTMVLKGTQFTLQGRGKGDFRWTPSTGLNRTDIANPIGSLSDDQTYQLTATTPEGCVATDRVTVEVFKGSSIYVPTAFTPDGNGRNDILKPSYTGINRLNYFSVYNRWGQEVFRTSDRSKGWDGTLKGKQLPSETFIWLLDASDVAGHRYQMKGTVVLIR